MNTILKHPTVNGCGTRTGEVQLINRGAVPQPYMTCWHPDRDANPCWGHYFDDKLDAIDDFVFRARRGY